MKIWNRSIKAVLFLFVMFNVNLSFAKGLNVQFEESAPKDRFIIVNQTQCTLDDMRLVIDLENSAAGLLFDTQSGGAGVNVYQPLEIAVGAEWVQSANAVGDGARELNLAISQFPNQGRIVITIDVDDTKPSGPLGTQMISNSEIAGAEVRVAIKGRTELIGSFDANGALNLPFDCTAGA